MFTDDAAKAVPLPGGFLSEYVSYAASLTTAPVCYHVASGLTALAGCSARLSVDPTATDAIYGIKFEHFGVLVQPNLYTLLIGKTGNARKSHSITICQKILENVQRGGEHLIDVKPGSPQALTKSLIENPNQLLLYSEFGSVLSQTSRRENQFTPIRELLCEAFDGAAMSRKLVASTSKSVKPRLNILGGVTAAHLEQFTYPVDWEGGLLNRFLMVYGVPRTGEPTREFADIGIENHLGETLIDLRKTFTCTSVRFSPAAQRHYKEYSAAMLAHAESTERVISAVATRLPLNVRKVAVLMAFDQDKLSRQGAQVDLLELEAAIRFGEGVRSSAKELQDRICETQDQRDRLKVLDFMRHYAELKQDSPKIGVIISSVKIQKRKLIPVLESLEAEGLISSSVSEDGHIYELNALPKDFDSDRDSDSQEMLN